MQFLIIIVMYKRFLTIHDFSHKFFSCSSFKRWNTFFRTGGKMNWFLNYSYRTICGPKVVVELLTKETNLPQETTSQNNNLLENFSNHVLHNRTLMNLKDLIWKTWGKELYDIVLLRYVKIGEKIIIFFCSL